MSVEVASVDGFHCDVSDVARFLSDDVDAGRGTVRHVRAYKEVWLHFGFFRDYVFHGLVAVVVLGNFLLYCFDGVVGVARAHALRRRPVVKPRYFELSLRSLKVGIYVA